MCSSTAPSGRPRCRRWRAWWPAARWLTWRCTASAKRCCRTRRLRRPALLAATAPALQELDAGSCALGDGGLRPLFGALAANTHLEALLCGGNGASAGFARGRLLTAVRANSSLRELDAGGDSQPAARAAEELVDARNDASDDER